MQNKHYAICIQKSIRENWETLNVIADGYQMDAKTGQIGKATVTGSKNMEYYEKLGTTGVHSTEYTQAVAKRLQKVVDDGVADGLSKAEITANLKVGLDDMRKILEDGKAFW